MLAPSTPGRQKVGDAEAAPMAFTLPLLPASVALALILLSAFLFPAVKGIDVGFALVAVLILDKFTRRHDSRYCAVRRGLVDLLANRDTIPGRDQPAQIVVKLIGRE